MSLWNPYSQALGGAPIVGQVPCKLVVTGPPLTAAQRTMAQNAYAIFCANHTLSIFSNTRINGVLADGSAYSISRIGAASIMQVQTKTALSSDEYLGGISYSVSDLQGNGITGWSSPDVMNMPKQFNVYEEVLKGTQKGSGVWRMRTMEFPSFGYKVFFNSALGMRCGAVDNIEIGISGIYSGSNKAGYLSKRAVGYFTSCFVDGVNRGKMPLTAFNGEFQSLVFLRKSSGKSPWMMQIHHIQEYSSGYTKKISLLAKLLDERSQLSYPDDVVHTLTFPGDHSFDTSSITFRPDGQRFKIRYSIGSVGYMAEFAVHENYLELLTTDLVFVVHPETVVVEEDKNELSKSFKSTTINRMWTEGIEYAGYNLLGNEFEVHIRSGQTVEIDATRRTFVSDAPPEPIPPETVTQSVETTTTTQTVTRIRGQLTMGGHIFRAAESMNDSSTFQRVTTSTRYGQGSQAIVVYSGFSESSTYTNGGEWILVDPVNMFTVRRETVYMHQKKGVIVDANGPQYSHDETSVLYDYVVMQHKGKEVGRFDVIPREMVTRKPIVYTDAAFDARTGGLFFSVFEYDNPNNAFQVFERAVNKRHQAFVLDGKGLRRLQEVINLPVANHQMRSLRTI